MRLLVTAAGLFGLAACGGDDATKPNAPPSTPAPSTTIAAEPGRPPPRPDGPAAKDTRSAFAVRELFLGDTDREGRMSADAWKSIGYDVDRNVTTRGSTDVCTLADGASKSTQEDGENGIDNAFAAKLLPVLVQMKGHSVSEEATGYLATADTLVFDVRGLEENPEQTNVGLSVAMLRGAKRVDAKSVPDRWSIDPSSLADGKTIDSGAKTAFADVYVSGGVLVASATSAIDVAVPIGAGHALTLRIHSPTISFRHSEVGALTEGLITGVLDPTELIPELERGFHLWQPATCNSNDQIDGLKSLVEHAVDIGLDGKNAAGSACRGISVGLGFRATATSTPSEVASPRAPTKDPCD